MSFIILLFLLLFALIFFVARWRKTSYLFLTGLVALFGLIGTGEIPRYLLENLQSDYEIKPNIDWSTNNAIVLLGAGTQPIHDRAFFEPAFFSFSRISEAASQYQSCAASEGECHIIVSGGDAQNHGVSEAEIYQQQLVRLGVPVQDIIQEANSVNTWKNAQFTSELIHRHQFNHVVLVSSGLHLRRGELYFAHFGVVTQPVRADYMAAKPSWLPIWYNFAVTDFALHEYLGFIMYDVYNAMGWNAPRNSPGDA
ncbi:YdcF family protein [Vibrio ostreicida]|uniref:YdcF family protein n=1 Tax=Vibrio ostreicida TaxID=526588 RepID=A0ABT8C037_9VIBR|nr:YdcF family protein [Vibrio ostreicida]MDN3612324.1 YdcF family protein [Vibrio ostreicida]NPD08705.1 YdcF family protein [Vibrio ostreicida]